ncbi:ATP-binding protein [Frankia sp. AiPs1]|uniref:AAA family ATPase n=1 Tax=Frankia sp. AiPs1 TaxID=573493 RepID=UPI0020442236|nr:ATP-binding protein [Frankia sp. AiPs1]MCM3920138.1 ATP-binding protein [Frankia sp. AiPs1]
MGLRPTHLGYAYQDLLTAIRLVDVALGRALRVIVDLKMFDEDRFDDVTCEWRGGGRERLQIKHSASGSELAAASFTGDRRSLRLDLLVAAVNRDLSDYPGTTYRIVLRDTEPRDADFASILKPVEKGSDPGPVFQGLGRSRFRFDPEALGITMPWRSIFAHMESDTVRRACERIVVDLGLPGCSLSVRDPGPIEQVLLRRVTHELGAGRPPNRHRAPEDVALALIEAAQAARSLNGPKGVVTASSLLPRLDLAVDFGAVRQGHPVDRSVEIARPRVLDALVGATSMAARDGGLLVVTGDPGVGKSWLCEQLADRLHGEWIVARHHCWLGAEDANRDRRVLAEVVLGSLLGQLEAAAPAGLSEVRPRLAATIDTLREAVVGIRRDQPDQPIALIVDGLDHVNRVLGHVDGAAFRAPVDHARRLVDELAAVDLPAGVVLVLASQPGDHLSRIDGTAMTIPPLDYNEIRDLVQRLGVLAAVGEAGSEAGDTDRERSVVELVSSRSRGNALYVTYLCRQAVSPGPHLGDSEPQQFRAIDPLDRLRDVPASASTLDEYYAYLFNGLAGRQQTAVSLLAVCDFAVTADELRDIFPQVAPTLGSALDAIVPIITQQPGIGGLKIHHESFSRFIRCAVRDETWIGNIREAAADWLTRRGFFTDARAFRHLPELLADLGRDGDLAALIGPDFLSRAIGGLQPPAAITHTLNLAARRSSVLGDWRTLVRCVELRRAADTYEDEGITNTLVTYADVLIKIVGVDAVAASLVYDGVATMPARWGLMLCNAVDTAGGAAPWAVYLAAREKSRQTDNVDYGDEIDTEVFLAELRGSLRLEDRNSEAELGADSTGTVSERVARFLGQDGLPAPGRVLDVLLDCLSPQPLLDTIPLLEDEETRATLLLRLAETSATDRGGLPSPRTLAVASWACSSTVDPRRLMRHGVPTADLADDILGPDTHATLSAATADLLRHPNPGLSEAMRRWLRLLAVAHERHPHAPSRLLPLVTGPGFFRAWLRFVITTTGLRRDVDAGLLAPDAASTTVRLALDHLARTEEPSAGRPGARDFWEIGRYIHQAIDDAAALLQHEDLEAALTSLNAVSTGTTTWTRPHTTTGPLVTTDLLALLSRTGAPVVQRLTQELRDTHTSRTGLYSESAAFELEMARLNLAAGNTVEARRCWDRAAHYMAAYSGRKETTIYELLDSVPALAAGNLGQARARLAQAQPLAYLVAQRTDGRSTWAAPHNWWRRLADLDPNAAADLATTTLLNAPGLPDALVDAAHHRLLAGQTAADPVVLAALRVAAGPGGRNLDNDLALLGRLEALPPEDPAHATGVLPVLVNAITSTYDDQPLMQTSSSEDGPEPNAALHQAAHRLGGDGAPPREPKPDNGNGLRDQPTRTIDTATRIRGQFRDVFPPGGIGAIAAVRTYGSKPYDETAASHWSADMLTNAIGWRLIEVATADGPAAAEQLLRRIADEFGLLGATEVLADLAAGLDRRRSSSASPGSLDRLTAVAFTLAFTKIRGGGGWLTFAGGDRLDLWQQANVLDPAAAAATLAEEVAAVVAGRKYGTYGVTRALIAAFADSPPAISWQSPIDASACWDAAFGIIAQRLPGDADIGVGLYRPAPGPVRQPVEDAALSRLALATLAMPDRGDRRRALLAAAVLLAARPAAAQAAVADVLAADLGAGPLTWLLTVLRDELQNGPLCVTLVAQLEVLAQSDMLSVRTAAANALAAAGLPTPDPPATPAHPKLAWAIAANAEVDIP